MKQTVAILFLIFIVQLSSAQEPASHFFEFSEVKLEKVLSKIERKFDVRYSYVDTVVAPKIITLRPKKYTLMELNKAISEQSSLIIAANDDRYFSLISDEPRIIHEYLREILVEGFLSKGINKSAQKVIISPQKVDALPGVTDADVLLSLQQLPGVKSPNETASGLHVRGGTSDQNLILWDGIRMYHPGHLFGMISGFNPNVEQMVHYYNKATNPKYGERISSVIDIRQTNTISNKLKVSAGTNALNADAYVKMPLVKDKLGLQFSVRKSFTELWQSPTFDALAEKVFQHTGFKDFNDRNRFQYVDYSAKLNYQLSDKTDFSITGILIDNHLDFNLKNANASTENQMMDISNAGLSLNWRQKYSEKFSHNLLLYFSNYDFDYEQKQFYADAREIFEKRNRITDSGGELNFDYKIWNKLNLAFGYQLVGNDISHSFTSGNGNFTVDLDYRRLYNVSHIGYSNLRYELGKWNFQAGARYNRFGKLRAESFEPRGFVQRKLGNSLVWQLSYERKSQIMSQIRETQANDLSLENYVWILADNRDYPIQKAHQYTTGLIYKKNSWLVDVDAYYKNISGITSLSFGFMHLYDSSIHKGKGFTKGIDILVQKSAPDWRAWITYTYQDSQNKYEGLNNDFYFPINSENKHALNLSFYKKWKSYSLAAGWFWHTGKPYSLLNSSNEIIAFNSGRLPDYHKLDLSGAYEFGNQKSWSCKIGFSIGNVYNRRVVISNEYQRLYTNVPNIIQSNYTVQAYYSLGLTPNIFVRFNF